MGKFIVIEGLDGSGKSSQIERLSERLKSLGESVYVTAEPTNFETGAYIRRILSQSLEKDMYLQGALFLADRIEHNTHPELGIRAHLKKGETVICDRYYYSSFAYQGTKIKSDWVMDINLSCPKIEKPDLCIFLDVSPKECKDRIEKSRESTELYEKSVSLMEGVRNNFLSVFERLSGSENIKIIDANRSFEEIHEDIFAAVAKIGI